MVQDSERKHKQEITNKETDHKMKLEILQADLLKIDKSNTQEINLKNIEIKSAIDKHNLSLKEKELDHKNNLDIIKQKHTEDINKEQAKLEKELALKDAAIKDRESKLKEKLDKEKLKIEDRQSKLREL